MNQIYRKKLTEKLPRKFKGPMQLMRRRERKKVTDVKPKVIESHVLSKDEGLPRRFCHHLASHNLATQIHRMRR